MRRAHELNSIHITLRVYAELIGGLLRRSLRELEQLSHAEPPLERHCYWRVSTGFSVYNNAQYLADA